MKSTHIPLTELPHSSDISWRINEAFEGYIPLDQMGLNVDAVGAIARTAGYFPHITVTTPDRLTPSQPPKPETEKPDESTGFSISISGINADGTAAGSAGQARRRPPELSNFSRGTPAFQPDSQLSSRVLSQPREILRIGLDVNAIQKAAEQQRGLRDPAVLSRLIGGSLRRQMLSATNEALFGESTLHMGATFTGYFGVTTVLNPNIFTMANLIAHGEMAIGVSALASAKHLINRDPDLHTGFTIFRFDRWALAQSRARMTRLVKPLK